jgi:cytochrome d ubiquinol oxidase subunit II
MEVVWFWIVAFMLAMYVILDGFDLGAGIIHLLAGKTEDDRRMILNAIGPVWDGNEVWLLAAGGTLYFAFPLLYASSFSGFYLPLMIVLWLLMLRGLGIEFRHHVHHPMWKSLCDVVFSISSLLLTIFFGAAMGNVVRGVPLNDQGYFFEPLWTTFTVAPEAGILDWFTVIMGLVAFFTMTTHGAHYISMKTEGNIQASARSIASISWWGILFTSGAALLSTFSIRLEIWTNYTQYPWAYLFPVFGIIGLIGMLYYGRRRNDTLAFLSSSLFIGTMLASTAFGLFPNVLPASTGPQYNLTIYNTATHEHGLNVGLVWWIVGMVFASGYFIFIYRAFRGKVALPAEDAGY